MNTLRVARILDRVIAWRKEKDVCRKINVPTVQLEDAYRLQKKNILKDFPIRRDQVELLIVLFVQSSNLANCKRMIFG